MKERLIVALDYSDMDSALALVDQLGEAVEFYKVGMQLYYSVGNIVVEELAKRNKKIFLDLKLHDIPNTVAGAIQSLANPNIRFLTIHGLGGLGMMKAAFAAKEKYELTHLKILAVTVLTSIDEEEKNQLNWPGQISDYASSLASLAKDAGVDGIICSPEEIARIKEKCGKDFYVVTPGIRPLGSDVGDQSRIATPAKAMNAGSDYLVVGRPITQAQNPKEAAIKIVEEMSKR